MDFFTMSSSFGTPPPRAASVGRAGRLRPSLDSLETLPHGAHRGLRSQVLPGERMLGPPELWPVRHHKRLLSLLHFQHLAVP
jgi:hypothetical protein